MTSLRTYNLLFVSMWLMLALWVAVGTCFGSYVKYRKEYCEVVGCENKDIEAHHIYAQSVHPELANEKSNIISLCRQHHVAWGHAGNTTRWYNTNIVEMVRLYNTGRTEMKK